MTVDEAINMLVIISNNGGGDVLINEEGSDYPLYDIYRDGNRVYMQFV